MMERGASFLRAFKVLKRNVGARGSRVALRSLKYFLLVLWQGVANNKHSRGTHIAWLCTTIIEKLDNFKHEWKSGSRATTRTGSGSTNRTRVHLRSNRNFRIAIRLSIKRMARELSVKRIARGFRNWRAFILLVAWLLKRVCNAVVVRLVRAFWIAVQRGNLLSSLVESFHSLDLVRIEIIWKWFLSIRDWNILSIWLKSCRLSSYSSTRGYIYKVFR